MRLWLCVFLLYPLCAPPQDAPDHPSPPPASTIAQERAKNDEAYKRFLTPELEADLLREHAGEWVGIANGKLLLANDAGHVFPTKELKECVAALDKAAPQAKHRYLFRVGDEGDVSYDIGGADLGNLLGLGLPVKYGLNMTFDIMEGEVTWESGGQAKVFKGKDFNTDLDLASAGNEAHKTIKVRHSTVFSAFLLLDAPTAQSLGLARFEIPGIAEVSRASGESVEARRAYAVIRVSELDIEELVPMGIFPANR